MPRPIRMNPVITAANGKSKRARLQMSAGGELRGSPLTFNLFRSGLVFASRRLILQVLNDSEASIDTEDAKSISHNPKMWIENQRFRVSVSSVRQILWGNAIEARARVCVCVSRSER